MFSQKDFTHLGVDRIGKVDWDENSLMWMATDRGLISYNGNSKKLYSADTLNENALLSNQILTFVIDENQCIWISYLDNQHLTKFDITSEKFDHFKNDSTRGKLVPDALISNIIPLKNDKYIVCSWGDGFTILDAKNNRSKHYTRENKGDSTGIRADRVKDVAIISDEKWIITYFESNQYKSIPSIFNSKTETFTDLPLHSYTKNLDEELSLIIEKNLEVVNFIHVDRKGNYWFGTYSGLVHLNNEDSTAQRILVDPSSIYKRNIDNTRSFTVDKNDLLWVSTFNSGILLVNQNTLDAKYIDHDPNNLNSVASNSTTTITNDPIGNIWVNTGATNFSIYNPYLQNFEIQRWDELPLVYQNKSAQNIPVIQMSTSKEGVNYLSDAHGVLAFDNNTKNYERVFDFNKSLSTEGVNRKGIQGFKLHKKKLYYGNNEGLFKYDLITRKITKLSDVFRMKPLFTHNQQGESIYFYRNSGDQSGIYVLDTLDESIEKFIDLPDDFLIITPGNNFLKDGRWILNTKESGFVIVEPEVKNEKFTIYNSEDSTNFFPDVKILCTHIDLQDGNVWIGTENGMYLFDVKTNIVTFVGRELNLENQSIKSINEDEQGLLWISLNDVLYKWDKNLKNGYSYTRESGLKSGSFLPAFGQKDQYGNIFCVARNGILSFSPKSLEFPSHKFDIALDQFVVNDEIIQDENLNQMISKAGLVNLGWDQNRLVFKLSNNQHFAPTDHIYFYRLKGVHKNWQSNGSSNTIKFSGLGYGRYTLEVKAVNTYNQETDIKTIKFKIQTPFWFSPWFYIIVFVFIIVMVILIVKLREKRIVLQKKKLEQTVKERTSEVLEKAAEIQSQKDIIEAKNIELTDSIIYAERIQNAILPAQKQIDELLDEAFVFYQPKEIVAGDFYWVQPMNKLKNEVVFAAADCTGHGVPGAIVSVICNNALNRSLREFKCKTPAEILNTTRKLVVQEFEKSDRNVQDGMDIAMCKLNTTKDSKSEFNLEFSGANNPLVVVRKKSDSNNVLKIKLAHGEESFLQPNKETDSFILFEIKGNKQPIGIYVNEKPFDNYKVKLEKNDMVYLFSDGYHDQFGKADHSEGSIGMGKKLKTGSFKNILLSMQSLEVDQQKVFLLSEFEKWRGPLEQIDDVCIVGVRV